MLTIDMLTEQAMHPMLTGPAMPPKVWLVWQYRDDLYGVYSTKEQAEAAMVSLHSVIYPPVMESWELDVDRHTAEQREIEG